MKCRHPSYGGQPSAIPQAVDLMFRLRNTRRMRTHIPSAADVRGWLEPLDNSQLQRLATLSGVPFTTLWKVRSGETGNPRLETVRQLEPHVEAAKVAA